MEKWKIQDGTGSTCISYCRQDRNAILNFPLPVWWKIIFSSFVGLMDPENIGLAIEITFLSCLQAEMKVLPV